jgi:hypothetical protein
MAISKHLITLVLFLFLAMPGKVCIAQSIDSEITLTEEPDAKDKKSDKKKVKDVIEINETFYINLAIDIAAVLLIISLIYYRNYKKMDYIFTFISFNLVIFVLTYVLNEVKISLGAAFGLFAVFSMLRYRTAGISMTDMTYLFIFIALGLISAIQLEYYELGILSGVIIAGTYLLDGNILFKRELSKSIRYENIELIRPENKEALMEDLKKRTGLNIHRVAINRINFLRDTASIRVYYYE